MLSKKQLFSRGMFDVAPHMLSVIPFGIICGAIGVDLGFSPYLVYGMSIIIFGGASQIVYLQLSIRWSLRFSSSYFSWCYKLKTSYYMELFLSEYLDKLSFLKKLLISYFVS